MKCYVVGCFAGFLALDDDFNLLDYELFPPEELLEKWDETQGKDVNPEEELILDKMGKLCDEIIIETGKSSYTYRNLKYNSKFTFQIPSKGGDYLRSHLEEVLLETGFLDSDEDLKSVIRELSIKSLKGAYGVF
jgi:nucleolar protein 56